MIREKLMNEWLKLAKKYDKGNVTDDDVLKELNSVVFHNGSFKPFIYELFFKVALENKIIIKSPFLLSVLFSNLDEDMFLEDESPGFPKTRMNILRTLDLKKSETLYHDFLIEIDNSDSMHKHEKLLPEKIDLHMVRESVLKESKEKEK